MQSLNEVASLLLKAARGAGLPLSHAEDLAALTPWLSDTATLLAVTTALETPAEPLEIMARNGTTRLTGHPLITPMTALDLVLAGEGPVLIPPPEPAILAAAVARAETLLNKQIPVECPPSGTLLHAPTAFPPTTTPTPQGPVHLPPDLLARLDALGARTYVPASDASRLAGAGAGLTDND
jgi:hypothetical protein